MTNFQGGKVALSFALWNREVAHGVQPQIGRHVDQVAETGLASTQDTENSSAQRLFRHKPREDTRNIANLLQLVHRGVDTRRGAVCGRVAMTAHTNAANSPLQARTGATIEMLP